MRLAHPPALATWLLEHLSAGERNDALAGDLLEEFRHGRSARWYWREVSAAILIAQIRQLQNRWTAVAFAALWSAFSPALHLLEIRLAQNAPFLDRIWQLDWPWSAICEGALGMSVFFSVLWVGLILYVALYACAARRISPIRLLRGLLLAGPIFVAASVIIAVATTGSAAVFPMPPLTLEWRHPLYMQIVMNSALSPYSLALFATLLPAISMSLPAPARRELTHGI